MNPSTAARFGSLAAHQTLPALSMGWAGPSRTMTKAVASVAGATWKESAAPVSAVTPSCWKQSWGQRKLSTQGPGHPTPPGGQWEISLDELQKVIDHALKKREEALYRYSTEDSGPKRLRAHRDLEYWNGRLFDLNDAKDEILRDKPTPPE